ncbi:MAG: hypothetical protein AB7O26_01645 [Planctomycetaceae bacterium]
MKTLFSLTLLALLALDAVAAADEQKPISIKPEEAKKHVGKKCVVEFDVKKTKHAIHRKKYYVDSEEDFHDIKNIGIQIDEPMALRLREEKKVEDVVKHYAGKRIRVTGVIKLEDDLPYIKLATPDDLEIVEKKSDTKK